VNLIEWLRLPQTRSVKDLDDPATTLLHAQVIQSKLFLRRLYIDFYRQLDSAVPNPQEKMLVELGSGGGFIKEVIPNVITSDIIDLPNVDKVFSAIEMPFENNSIDAFVMINVLHHITDSRAFFKETVRCLRSSGKIVMIEPANTWWSRFIYDNFHHEVFDAEASWSLEDIGPLSHGNDAIPWIIFSRDRKIFESEFPSLRIVGMYNHTPLRYLLSGGLTLRQLTPSFTYPFVKALEYLLSPFNDWLGMFQTIELEKAD
jgi:SAM-dependent methyltransferase